MGEVSVISETALAGLFLEVIVRHMPGQVGSWTRCRRTITEWDLVAAWSANFAQGVRVFSERRSGESFPES